MDFFTQAKIEADADDLEENIIKQFGKFGVNMGITKRQIIDDRIIFTLKTKGNTREAHIHTNAPEVQRKLKLPLFRVVKRNFTLYLIVSQKQVAYELLPAILNTQAYQEFQKKMQLPYIVGHDVLGRVVMDDLAKFPHLLIGGSTNSGKSVGLQALITSIAYGKAPSRVNFVLIDVGATDLMVFDGLPHLSCSVVHDRIAAIHTLSALNAEMDRRVVLEHTAPDHFRHLPRLVVVIDEFPALFMGSDKSVSKELTTSVSSLLQRGRHAKIHLVLAAQNPTLLNMKVDLGNITARIAFKCAKRNFSETILGEGGAENLMGQGDLLMLSPRYDTPQRLQGIYITPKDLHRTVYSIGEIYRNVDTNKFSFALPSDSQVESMDTLGDHLSCSVVKKWPSKADQELASVILWALEHESISINLLMKEYGFGWNKASRLVRRLEDLGIVDKPEGKMPRDVIPSSPEELPEDLMEFLKKSGYSEHLIINACYSRD